MRKLKLFALFAAMLLATSMWATIPIGSVDGVTGGNGSFRVWGWALDPDQPSTTVTIHVYIYPQGNSNPVKGYNATVANLNRPDLNNGNSNSIGAQYGTVHGFDCWIDITSEVPAGTYDVRVWPINVGSNEGNHTITYSGNGGEVKTITISNPYTVSYNANGGNGAPSAQRKVTNINITLSNTTPTRTGYTFNGWNTASNGSSGTNYAKGATYSANANATLYAKWKANTYTITLDRQGGSGGDGTKTATYGSATPTVTIPGRTGYSFGGYYTGKNGTGNQYLKPYDNTTATSVRNWDRTVNTTLYAKWNARTYTVTLERQGGTGGSASVTATYDANMPSMTKPTRTGYTFQGYYDATSGGTQYYNANGASVRTWNKASNTTLYARWTVNQYTISFDSNGGTPVASITQNYGTAVSAPANPTRDGYTFAGWDADIPTTMPAHDVHLVAHWNALNPTPTAIATEFAYCYDCQRSPAYPTVSGSCHLSGFQNPYAGYNGVGNPYSTGNTSAGPWKVEYVGNYDSSSPLYSFSVYSVADTYGIAPSEVEIYRLYQWNESAGEYQHAAYGVLCAYANENNPVEHAALFVANASYGCFLTGTKHTNSDDVYVTFDEDAKTGFADLRPAVIDLATITSDYDIPDGATLTGTLQNDVVLTVADNATITLSNVDINWDATWTGSNHAGITCDNATIILAECTTNKIRGFLDGNPGVYVRSGKTITIKGTGTLYAATNGGGAAIGSGYGPQNSSARDGGNIVILDGTIFATGGNLGAGIGSGGRAKVGNITIQGGIITATGGGSAAGIGCGQTKQSDWKAQCGNITITNGVKYLKATKGSGSDQCIGKGSNSGTAVCGTVTINGTTGAISTSPYTYSPAADNVKNLINAIGTVEYTAASKDKIDAARAAYEALADYSCNDDAVNALKNAVSNYSTLTAAEAAYNTLAANAVVNLINAIGSPITAADQTAIEDARAAYDALTDDQKALVGNLSTLTNAEAALAVVNLINAIGSPVTGSSQSAIEDARNAYDALTSDQQALVGNYATLTDAEAALAVVNLINAIDAPVVYTDACHQEILDAREAYNDLTGDQQALVGNYTTLTDAEAAYASLNVDITAKPDPQNAGVYYSTFYDGSRQLQLPADVEAYTATVSGDKMLLKKVAVPGDILPAATAVVLRASQADFSLTPSAASPVSVENNALLGTDVNMEVPSEHCYVLSGADGFVGFYPLETPYTLTAHKAYIDLDNLPGGANNAPRRLRFVFSEEQTATGMENVQNEETKAQKVMIDGVMYIIRGEHMYDAQGQIVK